MIFFLRFHLFYFILSKIIGCFISYDVDQKKKKIVRYLHTLLYNNSRDLFFTNVHHAFSETANPDRSFENYIKAYAKKVEVTKDA